MHQNAGTIVAVSGSIFSDDSAFLFFASHCAQFVEFIIAQTGNVDVRISECGTRSILDDGVEGIYARDSEGAIYYIESHCVRKEVPHSYERGNLLVKAIDGQLDAGGADPDGLPQINVIFIHDDFPEDAPTYKVRMRALGPDGEAFDDVCIHLVDRRMMCIG